MSEGTSGCDVTKAGICKTMGHSLEDVLKQLDIRIFNGGQTPPRTTHNALFVPQEKKVRSLADLKTEPTRWHCDYLQKSSRRSNPARTRGRERSRQGVMTKAGSGPAARPLTALSGGTTTGPLDLSFLPAPTPGALGLPRQLTRSPSAELEILVGSWRTPERCPARPCGGSWPVSTVSVTYLSRGDTAAV
ncbi:hypothetical protein SKAU_G00055060 [Synaphobranchus kaupii]|uniref:Uncharacterized protein n=1 Tax=Synaphobranchus kaupii TaxID=118154 RepID=A0A9Q1J909_SYNKA|nr:hypothetical protein SKAU_G00055060 [Synaphobranchus kaupii]